MKLSTFVAKALEESPGVPSSVRLNMFLCYIIAGVMPLVVWGILSLKDGKMLDFPPTLATYCGALILGSTGAKVYQYTQEPEDTRRG